MLTIVPCNLCQENDAKVIFPPRLRSDSNNQQGYACTNEGHGEHYQIVQCRKCGLRYCSPREDSDTLKKEYENVTDETYREEINGRIKTFERNLKNISRYKKTGKLIDVGCSIGVFLDLAKDRGWNVRGVEPSHWCIEQARQLFGIEIIQGTYHDLAKFNKEFDAVTMWDVLEHLDDPLQALKNCHKALKDDGILAFSTVDIGSFYARLLGKNWPWLMKMHIYYFDKNIIKQYLQKSGFEILALRTYKHIISMNYLLSKTRKISRGLYCLVKLLSILLLGRNIYLTIAMGDFMEVYARKRLTQCP